MRTYKTNLPLVIALTFFICISNAAISLSQSSSPDLPNSLKLGVRTDVPIVEEYCKEFGRFLNEELTKRLDQEVQIEPKSTLKQKDFPPGDYKRFGGIKKGIIDIECGSNSMPPTASTVDTSVWEGVAFSEPFYKTGIKLLARNASVPEPQNSRWTEEFGGDIGVAAGTTTFERLKGEPIYRDYIESYDTKDNALNALEQGEIKAFASDAIILRAILDSRFEGEKDSYKIFPDTYLLGPSEAYAIAVKANASYLQGLLNSEELLDAINATLSKIELANSIDKLKNYEINNSAPIPDEIWWKTWWKKYWKVLLAVILFCLAGVLVVVIAKLVGHLTRM